MSELPGRILTKRLPPVSRLAFGSLTVGPLQADLTPERAGEVLSYAFDRGINFLDTAQYYRNYAHIRAGLQKCRRPEDVMISSKTYAYDRAGALEAVDEARLALDRDVIDLFMLHEQESIHTLRGHREALDTLFALREKGVIRAVGISTHHAAAVEGVLQLAEEGVVLDVVHPLFNKAGIGIADGTPADMAAVLTRLHDTGCGIFGMKALAGGHLFQNAGEALTYVLEQPFMDAVAVGMQDEAEIDANIAFFTTGAFPENTRSLEKIRRRLHIEEYCEGCGRCVRRCQQGALVLTESKEETENPYDFGAVFAESEGIVSAGEPVSRTVAAVDPDKCVLCGYCTAVCPVFALKVY